MTTWQITLTDARMVHVDADEISVGSAGELSFRRAVAPAPQKLQPVLVLNARQWTMACPEDAPVLITGEPTGWGGAKPEPPKPPTPRAV
jgi:hypothetical protein